MTARTTTLRGVDAGRYYVEAKLGYYLDRGEPPGVWRGAGAQSLGLDGSIAEDDFLDLMAGVDPRNGELLGTWHTERTARGFDVTCSAPKAVSLLFAFGDADQRTEVLAAHDAAVDAVVDWIEEHAHVRYRVAGQVCVFDAGGIGAALFRQHSSRALDPQLHTHVVIPNRVVSPDGRWLALDARTIKRDQQTLSRLYHAGLRAEMSSRLGVRWADPVNGIAEIGDMPAGVLAEFSTRTRQVEARVEEKLDRFVESFDRLPTPQERWRLEREAVFDSRPAKADAEPATLEQEWLNRLGALGVDRRELVLDVVDQVSPTRFADETMEGSVVNRALEALAERQSTWRPAELVRELAGAVPPQLGLSAGDLAHWIDNLAGRVIEQLHIDLSRPIPDGVPVRQDGRPVTEAAVDRILTLPAILAEEERLMAMLEDRIGLGGEDARVLGVDDLDGPQRELADAVAGDRQIVLAVGPAGTGKTTAMRPAVEHLRREARAVFGVAPSATAAEVLGTDAGLDADTIDKLLVEHALDRPPDHRYDLPPGATVIVDEAAMVPTPRLVEVVDLAGRRGWRLALVGDPLQFSAVGRAGMFDHLVDTHGAIELGQVHRFEAAWERDASLRLRRGDTAVVDVYDRHGRIHGGTAGQMRRAVVDSWWQATLDGERAAIMAPTTAAVVELNVEVQRRRIDAGELDVAGTSIEVGPYQLRVADQVATRRNSRQLVTDRHLMVKNRDHWVIDEVGKDGSLLVSGRTGNVRLPAAYVAEHVELAYAETSHANQGRTVDRSFLYLDGPTDTRGVYVPLTRGRQSNDAFVVTHGEDTAVDVVTEALARDWIDRPAVVVRAEMRRPAIGSRDGHKEHGVLDGPELRRLHERDHDLAYLLDRGGPGLRDARRLLTQLRNERERLSATMAGHEAQLERARGVIEAYDRPLVRRRHGHELESARNQLDWIPRSLEGDLAKLGVVTRQEQAALKSFRDAYHLSTKRSELLAERSIVQHQLREDVRARGDDQAIEPAAAILQRLGPVPADLEHTESWRAAAGQIAQHREAYDWNGPTPLEPEPPGYLAVDAYASSHQAAREAIDRFDRILGRGVEIETPHRELGIELSL